MKITYIYHSGFSVELESCVLIFDYFKGNIPAVPANKPVYFFASHSHQDHFNLAILNMLSENNPKFILSNDIRLSEKYLERCGINKDIKDTIISVKKNDNVVVDNLTIETFRSTDAGCAFMVKADGVTIYHAGDMNVWVWPGHEHKEALKAYHERLYMEQLTKMSKYDVDVAFAPLDPRLKESYYLGIKMLLDNVKVKKLFPMHMWDEYGTYERAINNELSMYKDIFVKVSENDREWII